MSNSKRILSKVYHGSTHAPFHHVVNRLTPCKPCPLGDRWSSDINKHINTRAGLKLDIKQAVTPKATDLIK